MSPLALPVYQMLPALSSVRPWGPEAGVFSVYSLICPVFGSSLPSTFTIWPVYQMVPSDAASGSCGRDFGVGTSHSRIMTDGACDDTGATAPGAACGAGFSAGFSAGVSAGLSPGGVDPLTGQFFARYSTRTLASSSLTSAPRSIMFTTTSCHSSALRPKVVTCSGAWHVLHFFSRISLPGPSGNACAAAGTTDARNAAATSGNNACFDM